MVIDCYKPNIQIFSLFNETKYCKMSFLGILEVSDRENVLKNRIMTWLTASVEVPDIVIITKSMLNECAKCCFTSGEDSFANIL